MHAYHFISFHSLSTCPSLQIFWPPRQLNHPAICTSCTRIPVVRIHPCLEPLARRCRKGTKLLDQVDTHRRASSRLSRASRASGGYSQHMLAAYPSMASLPFCLRLVRSHFNMLLDGCALNPVAFLAPLPLPNPALPCPPPAPRIPEDSSPAMEELPND